MSGQRSEGSDGERRAGLAAGLAGDHRYRCEACGNLTRFDVVERSRTRRFHHYDLGGASEIEHEEVIDHVVESVTCRWCGRSDAIEVEPSPAARGEPT